MELEQPQSHPPQSQSPQSSCSPAAVVGLTRLCQTHSTLAASASVQQALATAVVTVAAAAAAAAAATLTTVTTTTIRPSPQHEHGDPTTNNDDTKDDDDDDVSGHHSASFLLPMASSILPQQQQPLAELLQRYSVRVPSDNNDPDQLENVTLKELDQFLEALTREVERNQHLADSASRGSRNGRAPGFYTRTDAAATDPDARCLWVTVPGLPYQTWRSSSPTTTRTLPVLSPAAALFVYQRIRAALVERIAYLHSQTSPATATATAATSTTTNPEYCSCLTFWEQANNIPYIANQVVEQVCTMFVVVSVPGGTGCPYQTFSIIVCFFFIFSLPQIMVEEGSECLKAKFRASEEWDELYAPRGSETFLSSSLRYHSNVPVTLLADRDKYMAAFTRAALLCTTSIQIMTCYLFTSDPAQHYLLFDLLPFLAKRGVSVQILIDLLPMESATIQSVFHTTKSKEFWRKPTFPSNITATSFLNHLPDNAPAYTKRSFASSAECLQFLLNDTSLSVQFWCARDVQERYRIKNHAKGAIFDRQAAIMGGSNLTPTVKSANSDLDLFLAGPEVVAYVAHTFDTLWNAMHSPSAGHTFHPPAQHLPVVEEKKEEDCTIRALVDLARSFADDVESKVAIVRSTPSSAGEDVIYRIVVEHIRTAKKEVLIAMGHSCYPKSLTYAVVEAVERGVKVKILVNSMYSNDLRTGQQDLFLSLAYLLKMAPVVEVYATTKHIDPTNGSIILPEFLHGKYVVIDGEWSAVGSWNLWTRAAFHEIEHEAFIQSTTIASILTEKFHSDQAAQCVRVSEEECLDTTLFRPKGCALCEGFGPFFADVAIGCDKPNPQV